MASTNKALTQEFYTTFQAAHADLSARVDALKAGPTPSQEGVNALGLSVAKLRKDLTDAVAFLPAYDQRQYEQAVKALEQSLEALRSASVAKPKFSFKRKSQKTAASSSTPPVAVDSSTADDQLLAQPNAVRSSASVSLSGHSHQYLSWTSVPDLTISATDLSISDLDHCIVNLLDSPDSAPPVTFTALHARNVRDTVLVLPFITGSAMIHDMTNCTIILGCHQFRMHTSSRVDVYLGIDSNPIIEHCSGIRFSSYPPTLVERAAAPDVPSLRTSHNLSVQDFSHIRQTPSPNWSIMSVEHSTEEDAWNEIMTVTAMTNPEEALVQLLPRP